LCGPAGTLLAGEGTEYWQFCFGLPVDPADLEQKISVYQSAYAHIMGSAAYEGMAGALPTADHPFSGIMNAARQVVFSRTLRTAEWANTTIAAGATTEEIDKLRRGGDGHIVVWGGVGLWRSLMWLDLIDELRLDLYPMLRARVLGCSTTSPSPTGSTWSPAPSSAAGPSGCTTAGTAKPAADMHDEWQSGERHDLSEGSMAQLKPTCDTGGIAAIDSGE